MFDSLPSGSKKNISLSIREGTCYAVMVGAAESYFGAFGVFLDASAAELGVLAALPPFFCAVCQIGSIWLLNRYPSRRPLASLFSIIQAAFILPIAFIPYLLPPGQDAVRALIILAICYFGAVGVTAPIWNSLIGDLVPAEVRGRFFGMRNQRMGFATLSTMLVAGGILHLSARFSSSAELASRSGIITGYLFIFLIAFLARLGSAYYLTLHDNPSYTPERRLPFSFSRMVKRRPDANFTRFALFSAAILGINAFSMPYFAPYLLKQLKLPYWEFSIINASTALALTLMHPYWGRLVDTAGCKRVLSWASVGVTINPFLWLVSADIRWLLFIQLFSGAGWSGFNLASSAFLFDAVPPSKRAYYAAYQGLMQGTFVLIGCLLGAWVVERAPSIGLLDGSVQSPFLFLFLLSGIGRFLACRALLHRFEDGRISSTHPHRKPPTFEIREADRSLSL